MNDEYHKRCGDCGRFLERTYWKLKAHFHRALCLDCMSNYED